MYKNHISQIALIFLFALQITSCERDIKQSISFEHEILEKYVLQEIQEKGISYSKDEYDNYWYSVKDREEVSEILKKNANIISTSVEISENELSPIYEADLASQNIPYVLEKFKDGRSLYMFSHEQYEGAKKVLHQSMDLWSDNKYDNSE